jgi:hypothetical protein
VKWSILVSLVASLILTLSCAKKQFPPGGPEDKTPPEILLTQPEHGSVGIGLQPTISISFSERMDRKRIREAIFVSPPPDGDIKTDWGKNSLRISFTDSLTPDKTYLVTIGSGATDEHNNKLEESFTLAFSTGETLDSGAIWGVVRENGQPSAGATVMAYSLAAAGSVDMFSELPEYTTQSGSDGSYRLGFVSPGDYVLFAFDDRNSNKTWNPPGEKIGFPRFPALLSSDLTVASDVDFDIFQRDTVPLGIKKATVTPDRILQVSLSQAALKRDVLQSRIVLTSADSRDTTRLDQLFAWGDTVRSVTAILPDLGSAEEFNLQIASLVDLWGNEASTADDSVQLLPPIGSDKRPPEIESIDPPAGSRHIETSPVFEIRYNEPIRIAGDTIGLRLFDPDSIVTTCGQEQVDRFTVSFAPNDTLRQGVKFTAILDLGIVTDLAGNRLTDSTINFKFETINYDSLGSFSGNVVLRYTGSGQTAEIFFATIPTGKWEKLEYDLSGHFHHEVVPGKYRFVGFMDRDNDGFLTTGKLSPFGYAEPLLFFGDTITVRPRFETEDIELNIK